MPPTAVQLGEIDVWEFLIVVTTGDQNGGTVNVPVGVTGQFAPLSVMCPVVAAGGTVTLIEASVRFVIAPGAPLKLTVVTPVKPEPEIGTCVPPAPLARRNPLTEGAAP